MVGYSLTLKVHDLNLGSKCVAGDVVETLRGGAWWGNDEEPYPHEQINALS